MYISKKEIEQITKCSVIKTSELMENLKEYIINKKVVYLKRDVQAEYSRMTSSYYEDLELKKALDDFIEKTGFKEVKSSFERGSI